jgi:hypothetical protein
VAAVDVPDCMKTKINSSKMSFKIFLNMYILKKS